MNTEAADQKGGSVFADFGIMCVLVLPCGKREKIWGAFEAALGEHLHVSREVWLFGVASALIYYYAPSSF